MSYREVPYSISGYCMWYCGGQKATVYFGFVLTIPFHQRPYSSSCARHFLPEGQPATQQCSFGNQAALSLFYVIGLTLLEGQAGTAWEFSEQ